MKRRFTNKELLDIKDKSYIDDKSLIQVLIEGRMTNCTNTNAPLYTRLQKLSNKVRTENEIVFIKHKPY